MARQQQRKMDSFISSVVGDWWRISSSRLSQSTRTRSTPGNCRMHVATVFKEQTSIPSHTAIVNI